MNPYQREHARTASELIWKALNANLVRRAAKKPSRPTNRVCLASEIPVENAEYESDVLLLMSGMQLRPHAKNAITLMVGNGETVRDIVRSFRQLAVIDRQLFGTLLFATDQDAKTFSSQWNDGHLGPLNIALDYEIERGTKIQSGTLYRGYTGPFIVAEQWTPLTARLKV